MAGQKNINIVYNVDTQQIQIAKAQVDQARIATDQLTQSTKNLSDQGAANTQKFGNNIETLRVQMQQLKAQIDLTNQSDTATLNQRIALYKEMQAQMDKYTQGLKETQAQTQGVTNSLGGLYTAVKTIITAGLIKETISASLEMAKLAGQVDGVKRAFDRLPNSIGLMDELRIKTHGTIDDLTLMQKAVQAQNFRIPLEQLGTLLEFASIKAQQTGLDIDYLTNSLITGLGRNSIRLLDNLQISVTQLRERTKELGSQQLAVFSIVNEQMKTMGGFIENSGTKVDQLNTSWKNLKQTVAVKISDGSFVSFLNDTVEGFSNFLKGSKQVSQEINQSIAASNARGFLNGNQTIETIQDQIDMLAKEMQARGALKATIKEQVNELINLHTITKQGEIEDLKAKYKALGDQNDISQKEIAIYKQKQVQLEATNNQQKEQVGLIEALDEKIKQLNEDLVKTTSRKNIIEIQVQIKQAEAEKADLLDPDRQARKLKEGFDKANDAIQEGIRSNSETILKSVSKASSSLEDNSLFKQLNKSMQKDIKMFVDGLKLGMKEADQAADEQEKRFQKLMRFTGQQLFTNARQIAGILVQNDVQAYDDRITALQDYYSNQEQLAGTNTKRVQQLQKEEAQKQKQLEQERTAAQKKANIRRIEIDTAANVIRSILENGGIPWGLPAGGIAAAMGLLQIAAVNKFAEGVIDLKGPGHDTSDNIPSLLSPGESVMTAKETRESGNILRSIRAKKLNDQVLDKLTITAEGITASFDTSPIVNELKKGRQPDLIKRFGVLYEVKEESKNMRKIIRNKSFNN